VRAAECAIATIATSTSPTALIIVLSPYSDLLLSPLFHGIFIEVAYAKYAFLEWTITARGRSIASVIATISFTCSSSSTPSSSPSWAFISPQGRPFHSFGRKDSRYPFIFVIYEFCFFILLE